MNDTPGDNMRITDHQSPDDPGGPTYIVERREYVDSHGRRLIHHYVVDGELGDDIPAFMGFGEIAVPVRGEHEGRIIGAALGVRQLELRKNLATGQVEAPISFDYPIPAPNVKAAFALMDQVGEEAAKRFAAELEAKCRQVQKHMAGQNVVTPQQHAQQAGRMNGNGRGLLIDPKKLRGGPG